jgi:uncharacterized protein
MTSTQVQESLPSQLAVYGARPTVRVNGQEYPAVSELLLGMEMTETEGGMSALELRLSNVASDPRGRAAFAFEDDRVLALGAQLTVYAGDENNPQEIFRGLITALESRLLPDLPPELVVLAEDAFQRARMQRRTAVHENVTIADLARQLANQLSLQPVITALDAQIGTQVQLNESDLAFLRRLLARYDGDLQVVGGEMHVSPRPEVRRGALTMQAYGQIHRARVLADLAHQVTRVTVTGWNARDGKRVSGSSTGSHLGPGSGHTGASVLQQASGDRTHHIGHLAVTTDAEARAVADAAFDERARRFVRLEVTAEGNPALRVGTHVTLKGIGTRFDNTYYVTRACHAFSIEAGYETTFEAECGYFGANGATA